MRIGMQSDIAESLFMQWFEFLRVSPRRRRRFRGLPQRSGPGGMADVATLATPEGAKRMACACRRSAFVSLRLVSSPRDARAADAFPCAVDLPRATRSAGRSGHAMRSSCAGSAALA
ncbi:hypothetical protein AQ908_12740 [Burkholderia pseudomallei]|nr:hypothetical protein AQ874_21720 [Burkholderia pseudomallei]ONB99983.1 hypothetical protein AQ908_12740 [Burkholderia pseudomallei]